MLPVLKWLLVILQYYDMALFSLGAGAGEGGGIPSVWFQNSLDRDTGNNETAWYLLCA